MAARADDKAADVTASANVKSVAAFMAYPGVLPFEHRGLVCGRRPLTVISADSVAESYRGGCPDKDGEKP